MFRACLPLVAALSAARLDHAGDHLVKRAIQRLACGRKLLRDIFALFVCVDHSAHCAHLTFDARQARKHRLLCLRIVHLGIGHSSVSYTPDGIDGIADVQVGVEKVFLAYQLFMLLCSEIMGLIDTCCEYSRGVLV